MTLPRAQPRAIARLELSADVPLDAATAQVGYFARLGISHLATSPLMASRPGVFGGVTDPEAIDPRLGGEEALARLVAELRRHDMGLIVDLTPAALAVGGDDNAIWRDLLEWGRDSAHAHWFDMDWRGSDPDLRNIVLVPFLAQPYGVALAAGALHLAFDSMRGAFVVRHGGHSFPISPLDYGFVLEASGLADAAELAAPFTRLPRLRPPADQVAAARAALIAHAATPQGRIVLAAATGAFDPRVTDGRDRLHLLLERQSYRLTWRGTAADALNWTRLPGSAELAALRIERPDVFDAIHATPLRLFAAGLVDGFVIRQWDLLPDPAGYAARLRLKLDTQASRRPPGLPAPYIAIDTALPAAALPPAWPVAGTAGADARATLGAVLHDPAGAAPLGEVWMSTTGERRRLDEQIIAARAQALNGDLHAQLDATVEAVHDVAVRDAATRDATRPAISRVLSALAISFRAARTYAGVDGFSPADAATFAAALQRARRRLSPADGLVADQVTGWLGAMPPRSLADFEQASAREHAIAAFQQLTAAVAALGNDQMMMARHGRLISANQDGADLTEMALSPSAFHARLEARAARGRHAITATSGARQRLGEDTRMRLAVLSEAPWEWDMLLRRLMEAAQPFRTRMPEGVAPEPADAVILFQALVGIWPATLRPDDTLGLADLNTRLRTWWIKGLRAARGRTDPLFIHPDYEAGCLAFLAALLESEAGLPLRREISEFVPRLTRAATLNALSQTVLKCTVPGIPELFQGCEFWDMSLGEADGARAVDYAARAHGLNADEPPHQLLKAHQDGRVKQAVLARLLRLRAEHTALFQEGSYEPLEVEGSHARHVLAFARRHQGALAVTVVTRLAAGLLAPQFAVPQVPPARWAESRLRLPEVTGVLRDALTGREVPCPHGRLHLTEVLRAFPAAVLLRA